MYKVPMTLRGGSVILAAVIWQIAPRLLIILSFNGLVNTDIIEQQEIQGRPPFCHTNSVPLIIVTLMQISNDPFLTANQILF